MQVCSGSACVCCSCSSPHSVACVALVCCTMDFGEATGGTLADEFLMDFDEEKGADAVAAAAASEQQQHEEAMEQDAEVRHSCVHVGNRVVG